MPVATVRTAWQRKGVADRDHGIADVQRGRRPERCHRQPADAVDLDRARRRSGDHARPPRPYARSDRRTIHLIVVAPLDTMVVGEDVAVCAHDHPRPGAALGVDTEHAVRVEALGADRHDRGLHPNSSSARIDVVTTGLVDSRLRRSAVPSTAPERSAPTVPPAARSAATATRGLWRSGCSTRAGGGAVAARSTVGSGSSSTAGAGAPHDPKPTAVMVPLLSPGSRGP